jgi:hypothetical protein
VAESLNLPYAPLEDVIAENSQYNPEVDY